MLSFYDCRNIFLIAIIRNEATKDIFSFIALSFDEYIINDHFVISRNDFDWVESIPCLGCAQCGLVPAADDVLNWKHVHVRCRHSGYLVLPLWPQLDKIHNRFWYYCSYWFHNLYVPHLCWDVLKGTSTQSQRELLIASVWLPIKFKHNSLFLYAPRWAVDLSFTFRSNSFPPLCFWYCSWLISVISRMRASCHGGRLAPNITLSILFHRDLIGFEPILGRCG